MDPIQELLAQFLEEDKGPQPPPSIWRGDSSENYNPMQRGPLPPEYRPRPQDLPEGYQIERRSYRGSITPMEEFDKQERERLLANPDPNDITQPHRNVYLEEGDIPGEEAMDAFEDVGPTDQNLQDWVEAFGWERLTNPRGPPEGYIPEPRPRRPTEDPNQMFTPGQVSPPMGTLRTQDVIRELIEGPGQDTLMNFDRPPEEYTEQIPEEGLLELLMRRR